MLLVCCGRSWFLVCLEARLEVVWERQCLLPHGVVSSSFFLMPSPVLEKTGTPWRGSRDCWPRETVEFEFLNLANGKPSSRLYVSSDQSDEGTYRLEPLRRLGSGSRVRCYSDSPAPSLNLGQMSRRSVLKVFLWRLLVDVQHLPTEQLAAPHPALQTEIR